MSSPISCQIQQECGSFPVSPPVALLATLPLQEGRQGSLGGASQGGLAAVVCAQEVLAASLPHQSAEVLGWVQAWLVGGRMVVPGVGGNVMFIPPKSIPGSKQRPELPNAA